MKKIILTLLLIFSISGITFANDTDGDGIIDSLDIDIDNDWLTNELEITWWNIEYDFWDIPTRHVKSNPNLQDADWDGLNDLKEKQKGTDPNDADTDNDGVSDLKDWEITPPGYTPVSATWFYQKDKKQESRDPSDLFDIWAVYWPWNEDYDGFNVTSAWDVSNNESENWDNPNINTGIINDTSTDSWSKSPIDRLKDTKSDNQYNAENVWVQWIYGLIISIAKELKNIIVWILTILILFAILRLIFSSKSEEEMWKLKNTILWSGIWIILMQIANASVLLLQWTSVDEIKAVNFTEKIIQPLVNMLVYWASFLFIWVALMSFYALVSSNWDDGKASEAKTSIMYAIIWMIIIKISWSIISAFYWQIWCRTQDTWNSSCRWDVDLSKWVEIFTDVINWVNSFILIITTVLIIYTWYILMFAWAEEWKFEQWKKFIRYILTWLALVWGSYILLAFITWKYWSWVF